MVLSLPMLNKVLKKHIFPGSIKYYDDLVLRSCMHSFILSIPQSCVNSYILACQSLVEMFLTLSRKQF